MKDHSPLRAIPAAVKKHKREIDIPRPPAMLAETVARARRYGAGAAAILEDSLEGIRRAYQKSYTAWFGSPAEHANPEMFTSFDRVLWMGAFCVMLFECLCAAVLASMTLAVPSVVAVLVGIGLTALLTLTMKAVWHLHIAPDEIQPRRALATLYRWLMPLFLAWALALVVAFLLPRLVDESTPLVNMCFNIDMSVLTVLSPALSGLLFAAAHLYGWARAQTGLYNKLLAWRREVESLLGECERAVPSPGSAQPGPNSVRHRESPELIRHAGQAALGMVMVAMLAAPIRAQTRGEFWLDDSGSANVQDLRSAEDQFFAVLPAAVNAGVHSWEFFRFSRNSANARPVARFGINPFVEPACGPVTHSNELTKLFQRPQRAAERSREKQCAERLAAARHEFEQELSNKVMKTREAFDVASRATGTCTALLDLMNRIRNQPAGEAPPFVVIVSDAIESCVMLRGVRLEQPKTQLRVLMVVVPSAKGGRRMSPWQEFELRKKNWGETAPWLEVLPLPLLTGAAFAPRPGKD